MTLEEIIDAIPLPHENLTTLPFVQNIENCLNEYLGNLRKETGLFDSFTNILLERNKFIDLIEYSIIELVGIIRKQKEGKPDEAYKRFANYLESIKSFLLTLVIDDYSKHIDGILFRCKNIDSTAGKIKPRSFFFHAPFELSEKVKSTRFSYPGFPTLYLSNCLIVAMRESRTPSIDNLQAVKFKNLLPVRFLNLDMHGPDKSLKTSDVAKYENQLTIKALLLPLYLTCFSIKKDENAAAPDEYIIPQFFNRWNREVKLVDGIKYNSTLVSRTSNKINFYNVIIPPFNVYDTGYCDYLKKVFNMSEGCSWALHQKEIETFFHKNYKSGDIINDDVTIIQWPPGAKTFQYSDTEIGKMELYIRNGLDATVIDF